METARITLAAGRYGGCRSVIGLSAGTPTAARVHLASAADKRAGGLGAPCPGRRVREIMTRPDDEAGLASGRLDHLGAALPGLAAGAPLAQALRLLTAMRRSQACGWADAPPGDATRSDGHLTISLLAAVAALFPAASVAVTQ
jgi:hypothetical protein